MSRPNRALGGYSSAVALNKHSIGELLFNGGVSRDQVSAVVRLLQSMTINEVLGSYDHATGIPPGELDEAEAMWRLPDLGAGWADLFDFLCNPKVLAALAYAAERLKGTPVYEAISIMVVLLGAWCKHRNKRPSEPKRLMAAVADWAQYMDDAEAVYAASVTFVTPYVMAKAIARNVAGFAPPASSASADALLAAAEPNTAYEEAGANASARSALGHLLPRVYVDSGDNATAWMMAAVVTQGSAGSVARALGATPSAAADEQDPSYYEEVFMMQRVLRGGMV